MDQELVKYIRDNYAKGFPLEQIVSVLRSVGWRDVDIEEAVNAAVPYYTPVTPQEVEPENQAAYEPTPQVTAKSNHHVAMFVLLGVFVVIGLIVLMNVLNVALPSAYQGVLTKVNEVRSDLAAPEVPAPDTNAAPIEETPQVNDNVEYPTTVPAQKEQATCATFSCFKNTVSSCGPSSLRDTVIKDGLGTKERVTSFYALRGVEEDKCKVYVKTESIDVTYTDAYKIQLAKQGYSVTDISAKEIQENVDADKEEGLDGLCLIRPQNITAMLDRWEQGVFRTTDMSKKFCTGGLFP